jgi:putative ABC transport system permease protein
MTIFFSSMGIVFISNAQNFANQYNPYHIAYAEIYGKNKLAPETVNSIVNSGVTPLTNTISVDYIQTGSVTIFSAAELNKKLENDIHVNTGHFINLFQVVLTDGYEHQMVALNRFPVGNIQLTSQGNLVKVIINTLPTLGTNTIILNHDDYVKLMQQVSSDQIGIIHLFNYKDWRKTAPVADKLTAALHEYNIHNTKPLYHSDIVDSQVFSPVSRIGIYTQTKQSGGFMLFLFSFVGLLFFISTAVIIHFKLLTEFENEKVKYKKLYKIGITKRELAGLISKELFVLFLLPNLVAAIIAAIYNYSFPIKPGEGIPSLYFSIEVGTVYLCLQILYYFIYKKYYIGKFNDIFE